jgi:hypothetical protein
MSTDKLAFKLAYVVLATKIARDAVD